MCGQCLCSYSMSLVVLYIYSVYIPLPTHAQQNPECSSSPGWYRDDFDTPIVQFAPLEFGLAQCFWSLVVSHSFSAPALTVFVCECERADKINVNCSQGSLPGVRCFSSAYASRFFCLFNPPLENGSVNT